jgi:hypothetical protein
VRRGITKRIITGTVINDIGYSLYAGPYEPFEIVVVAASCTPPPKNCTYEGKLDLFNTYTTSSTTVVQYVIVGSNIGTSPINSFSIQLPST